MRRVTFTLIVASSLIASGCVGAPGGGAAPSAASISEPPASIAPPLASTAVATSPGPSFPGQVTAPFPTVGYLPVVTAERTGTTTHVHFDGLVLDMPSAWTIHPANVDMDATKVDAFVGTAASVAGCFGVAFQSPAVGATSCSYDLRLGPGDVSIALEITGGGPYRLVPVGDPTTLQPGERLVKVDGVPAVRNNDVRLMSGDAHGMSLEVQDVTNLQQSWRLEGAARDPGAANLLAQVADVFASVHYATRPTLPDTSVATERKVLATALAQLRGDDAGYACFPAEPGGTAKATISALPGNGTPSAGPIAVTCRTDLTPFGAFWTLTLTVSWQDAGGGPGSSVASMLIAADGTVRDVAGFDDPLPEAPRK